MDQPIIHLHWSGKYNNVMLVLRYKWKLWLQLSLGILNKSESCWQYYTALPVSELAISKWEQKKLHRLPRLSHSSNTVCISSIKSWRWSLNRVHWSRKCSTSSTPSPQYSFWIPKRQFYVDEPSAKDYWNVFLPILRKTSQLSIVVHRFCACLPGTTELIEYKLLIKQVQVVR